MLDRKPQQDFDAPMVGILKSIFFVTTIVISNFLEQRIFSKHRNPPLFLYFEVHGWSGLDRPRLHKSDLDSSIINYWNNWLFHIWHNCWCRLLEVRVTGSIFLRNEKSLHAEIYASWFLVYTDLSGITWWFPTEKKRSWQSIRFQRQIIRWTFFFRQKQAFAAQLDCLCNDIMRLFDIDEIRIAGYWRRLKASVVINCIPGLTSLPLSAIIVETSDWFSDANRFFKMIQSW